MFFTTRGGGRDKSVLKKLIIGMIIGFSLLGVCAALIAFGVTAYLLYEEEESWSETSEVFDESLFEMQKPAAPDAHSCFEDERYVDGESRCVLHSVCVGAEACESQGDDL